MQAQFRKVFKGILDKPDWVKHRWQKLASVKKNSQAAFTYWVKYRWQDLLLLIQIFAFVSAIFGWYIDHSNQSIWVKSIFTPRYSDASSFYNNLFESLGSEFNNSTPGFSEVADVLCESILIQLPDLGDCTIVKLKVISKTGMVISINPDFYGPTVKLQLDLWDGRQLPLETIKSVTQSQIQDRFLEKPLFRWGGVFFWPGIVIALGISIIERTSALKE